MNDYNHITSAIEQLRYKKHAKEVCKLIPKNGKILDMGCGMGHFDLMLREERSDIDITGIDLREWSNWWDKYCEAGIEFVVGDALHTSFKDGEFDVVVSSGLFEHVDAAEFFREVWRLLKPGGYNIILNVPSKYGLGENLSYMLGVAKHGTGMEKRYTKKMLKGIISSNSFDVVSLHQEGFVPAQFGVFGKGVESFMNKFAKPLIKIDGVLSFLPLSQSFIAITRRRNLCENVNIKMLN